MFLHIVRGDPKFLAAVHNLYESAAPGENRFVAFVKNEHSSGIPPSFEVVRNESEILRILYERNNWSGVLCNGLLDELAFIINHLSADVRLAWVVWGMEIYNNSPNFYDSLFEQETRRFVAAEWKHKLRPWVWRIKDRLSGKNKILNRINYCICPFREEFDYIMNGLSLERPRHLFGWVGARDDSNYEVKQAPIKSDSIQVGNSATFENNHVEIFRLLADSKLGNRKVIVPLSYGNPDCRRIVTKMGEKLLGNNFQPVHDFMPLTEYNELMSKCSMVILNHNRQQGMGNILTALKRGAQVFLRDTPVFKGLRGSGVHVHAVDEVVTYLQQPNRWDESQAKISLQNFEKKFSFNNRLCDVKMALTAINSASETRR
jgi:dTDP-N-acetylfucosamine:lipid II N-acetylfucosaminyltransferase